MLKIIKAIGTQTDSKKLGAYRNMPPPKRINRFQCTYSLQEKALFVNVVKKMFNQFCAKDI